jgi:hypothetical protein
VQRLLQQPLKAGRCKKEIPAVDPKKENHDKMLDAGEDRDLGSLAFLSRRNGEVSSIFEVVPWQQREYVLACKYAVIDRMSRSASI